MSLSLRNTDQAFCIMSANLSLSGLFLMLIWGLWFWGRKNPEIKLHSHYIMSRVHNSSTRLIIAGVSLDHLAEVAFIRFLRCKVTPFPFHTVFFGSSK